MRSMIRNTEMSYVRLEMSFPPIPAISLVAAFDPFLPLAAPQLSAHASHCQAARPSP